MQLKIKEGALSESLGVPVKDNIPLTLLRAIKKAQPNTAIKNPTKSGNPVIIVTPLMIKQARLAYTMKTKWRLKNQKGDKTNGTTE